MSRIESEELTQDGLAFEYVSGTLRGHERKEFEQVMREEQRAREQVQFWEEQLHQLSETYVAPSPAPITWDKIAQRISTFQEGTRSERQPFDWKRWLLWLSPNVVTALVVCAIFLYLPQVNQFAPNAEYVAVLSDKEGKPLLSALTVSRKHIVWLKWEQVQISSNKNLQLWAVSKRDGQARPIDVFAQTKTGEVNLPKSSINLIKEAEYLLLTEEDVGGSPIAEPSSKILAKGACVLITNKQNNS